MKLEERINQYIHAYGIETLNLIVQRHDLMELKRTHFTIRYMEQDAEKEKELTLEMEKIQEQIDELDKQIEAAGVDPKKRPTIIKDLKKYYPNDWFGGFVEG